MTRMGLLNTGDPTFAEFDQIPPFTVPTLAIPLVGGACNIITPPSYYGMHMKHHLSHAALSKALGTIEESSHIMALVAMAVVHVVVKCCPSPSPHGDAIKP